MALAALMVLGALAYSRVPVKLFPDGLEFGSLYIRIDYRNSSPQESEQQITRPLEETLRAIKGVERLRTWSSDRGTRASISFRQGVDISMAYNQVIDRLDRLKPQLPAESRDRVRVYKFDASGINIVWVGVTIDPSIVDRYQFMQRVVVRALERIDGVGIIDLHGVDEKEVMVEIDQDRLRSRGLTIGELVQSLQSDNFALTGGHVREGSKKLFVRSIAKYSNMEEIQRIKVRTRKGREVLLKDVATIAYDVPERRYYNRLEGKEAVSFGIKGESGANIIDTAARVKLALAEIENKVPGMTFNVFYNQGDQILEAIRNLQGTGLWGGLFAALILLYFLRTVRMTSIITLSIPLCLLMTLTVIYFIDWSLNMITMMGLMVGVGMVVDNGIVILENIYRVRGQGEEPRKASILGASEVGLAITMATLTTVVVFLPLMLMGGKNRMMNFYLTKMGLPIIIALVASLFVALIFIPLAAARLGGSVKGETRLISRLKYYYTRALAWTLSHRRDAILMALVGFMTISIPMGNMKRGGGGSNFTNSFRARLYMPKHFGLEETVSVLDEVKAFYQAHREEYDIRTIRTYYRPTYGNLQIFLNSRANEAWWYVAYKNTMKAIGSPVSKEMERSEVLKHAQKNMPTFVGVTGRVDRQSGGTNDPSVNVVLQGDDTEVLLSMVDEVSRRLATIPSVLNVQKDEDDDEKFEEEVRVHVDRDRANAMGISAQNVARQIGFALQGVSLPRFQADEREVQVKMYLERGDRKTLQQLKNFTFPSSDSGEVALSGLATISVAKSTGDIYRADGKTRIVVKAFTTKQDRKGLYNEVDIAMAGFSMPRGYTWNKGERYRTLAEEDDTQNFATTMAITFVFLLMGILFESFILPFSVLFSIPFAFLGVYWFLFITGTPMNMMAMVGMIILIGVVVNNAIVLVDMVNRLRKSGMGRTKAILEAGENRFRPILMTTFTTIFGLLPMSVGNSNLMGQPYSPLGRTMMGGLISSTLLTLLVVPLLYTFLDDLALAVKRLVSGTFGSTSETVEQSADD
jgi:hydrophobic/amphiphilic exporter-1 (mainly G- bacteria), HAE1 family